MINSIKNAGIYLLIAGATAGTPILSDTSGLSSAFAKRSEYLQRQELVSMSRRPEAYGENADDISRNIAYIDSYKSLRETSARLGFNFFLGLLALAGTTGTIAAKRKLEILFSPEVA